MASSNIEIVKRTVDRVTVLDTHRGNPFEALYHNPHSMSITYFAKFAQRYLSHRLYRVVLDAAHVTGYEPIPVALVPNHIRPRWKGRRVSAGQIAFFLVQSDEIPPIVQSRYDLFKRLRQDTLDDLKTKSSFNSVGVTGK